MSIKKIIIISLTILVLFLIPSCSAEKWNLVCEGNIVRIEERAERYFITFANNKVAILKSCYSFEFPDIWIVGDYYYIYI